MKPSTAARIAWPVAGAVLLTGVLLIPAESVTLIAMAVIGAFIASRRPDNTIGWLFCIIAVLGVIAPTAEHLALSRSAANPPTGALLWFIWLGTNLWLPAFVIGLVFLPLLFPSGRLLSPGWRWVARIAALGTVLFMAGNQFQEELFENFAFANPAALPAASDAMLAVATVGMILLTAAAIAAVVSLVIRYRRSRGDERQQMKWFVTAAVLAVAMFIANAFLYEATDGASGGTLGLLGAGLLPVAAGLAILRYRLYDIDVIISKTIVYTGLAAFVTAVYVGIVVGAGTLIGSPDNIVLSVAATAVVAFAFQPVRERVQHVANRVVFGERATPYEVLSRFSEQVSDAVAPEEALQRMARSLAEGTGAARAAVLIRVDGELRPAAVWPPQAGAGGEPDLLVSATHQGEELGAIAITKPAGESPTAQERKLIEDLSGQAGLILRNAGLDADLLARMDDLRESRQRLVKAQDEERRRLERDLHDGAQQHLVALKVNLGIALSLGADDPAKPLIEEMQAETGEALETLRDLARGIYPPMLASDGLPAALRNRATKAPMDVTVEAESIGRFPQEVEAAVYFCVLEALQNAAKYAGTSLVTVRVRVDGSALTFEVADHGPGFDTRSTARGAGLTNMADRMAAMDGTIVVSSTPGGGTTVRGSLPARVGERVG